MKKDEKNNLKDKDYEKSIQIELDKINSKISGINLIINKKEDDIKNIINEKDNIIKQMRNKIN